MTRYARATHGTHRKPQEATPWSELKPKGQKAKTSERKVQEKSKAVKKQADGEPSGADYRRGKKKKRKPQWKRTEWEMIETGLEETRGLAADLLKMDKDAANPTLYRPKKIAEKKPQKSLADRLRAIQDQFGGEFTKEQQEQVAEVVKKDDRRENRRVKRIEERASEKACFNCREKGHDMSDCPKLHGDMEHGTGICFKCGSTEHDINSCHVRLPPGVFPYAKCFICKESGHLSKQCPDNPRGLYPNGGCCKGCGSVEHYNKDCPEVLKKQGLEGVAVSRIRPNTNTELDEGLIAKPSTEPTVKKKKPKVVKF